MLLFAHSWFYQSYVSYKKMHSYLKLKLRESKNTLCCLSQFSKQEKEKRLCVEVIRASNEPPPPLK